MSIDVIEKVESRKITRGDTPGAELVFVISGTEDPATCEAALLSVLPTVYAYMAIQNYNYVHKGGGVWEATAKYGARYATGTERAQGSYEPKPTPQAGDIGSWSFDTSGGTQHITNSLTTVSRSWKQGDPAAPDLGGLIGLNGNDIAGCDITVPAFTYEETWVWPLEVITPDYIGILFNLTGKTNASAWKHFAQEECLFMGASGQQRSSTDCEIRYRFSGSKTRTNFQVGNVTVSQKRGWHYMWVKYKDEVLGAGADKVLAKSPSAVYIERVYEMADFTLLGIGL